jgi:protein-tyrosine phosphatase
MPFEILPHLLLGNATDAMAVSHNTKMVVNCTKEYPFYVDSAYTHTHRIPVDDDGYETHLIGGYWTQELFDNISNHILQGHDVLIHCHMGRQRSAATVAAYIIRTLKWSLPETIKYIKERKKDAFFPDVNFHDALEEFANTQ